jgi:hypothetical protein
VRLAVRLHADELALELDPEQPSELDAVAGLQLCRASTGKAKVGQARDHDCLVRGMSPDADRAAVVVHAPELGQARKHARDVARHAIAQLAVHARDLGAALRWHLLLHPSDVALGPDPSKGEPSIAADSGRVDGSSQRVDQHVIVPLGIPTGRQDRVGQVVQECCWQ